MRILIVHSFYRNPGGEDRHVREQAALLASHHDVEMVSADNRELSASLSTAAQMTFSYKRMREVRGLIDVFQPHVIHIHNIYPSLGPSVHLAAEKAGVPVVMTVHNFRLRCPNGLMFTEGAICRRCQSGMHWNAVIHRCFPSRAQGLAYAEALWLHRFLLRLEKKIALFLAPSSFMQRRIIDWGLDPKRVRLVRNFVTAHDKVHVVSENYGVFAGRLSTEKGLEVLINALGLVGDPPFKILGDGPLARRVAQLTSELRLSNLSIMGWRPPEETIRLMSAARFAVIPSVWEENAPLAALEAMSLGLPMVVSNLGGLPELASQGTGLVSKANDAEDLAAKMTTLLSDDELCTRLGSTGLEVSRTLLSPEAHLSDLEAAYREAMDGAPPRSGRTASRGE